MIKTRIFEDSSPRVQDNVLVGVKIVGTKSRRGYAYPVEVLRKAKSLYEDAPVYVLHGDAREKRQRSRRHADHFGSLQNIRERGNGQVDGLFGDLHVKMVHPLAARVLEAAPTAKIGLSHSVVVAMNRDKSEVTEILKVDSVDLVDKPATTTTLFEENEMPEDKMDNPDGGDATQNGSFEEKMLAFMAKILAYIEPKDADLVKNAEKAGEAAATESLENSLDDGVTRSLKVTRLTAIESRDDEMTPGNMVLGNTHGDFLNVLRGLPITN